MDLRRFNAVIQRLSRTRSRRLLVGGSLGASMLAALGLDEDAIAQKKGIRADACIPSGRKCPAKKSRGKKGKKLGCTKCCQGFTIPGRKGKRKCACKPDGQPCTPELASQCCSATCGGGVCGGRECRDVGQRCNRNVRCCTNICRDDVCRATACTSLGAVCGNDVECCSGFCGDGTCRAAGSCTEQGSNCTTGTPPAPCCTGVCNAGGTDAGPIPGTANECAACRTSGATCDPAAADTCCGDRTCTAAGNTACCGITSDPCVNADPVNPAQSSCCTAFQCPAGGGVCEASP